MDTKRFVVRLRKDPAVEVPPETHHKHVDRLVELNKQGVIENYGPVAGGAGGILVLSVADRDAAERVVREDPLVAGGYETPEIWEWTRRP